MFNFFYGTQLENLADRLIEVQNENPPQNPLSQEIFVVQNHGMGQWLSLRMAQKEGIAANLKFEFPSERLWSLIRQLNPDIPQTLPSDRGPMTWTLMQLFKDSAFLSEFPNLHHYIKEEDSKRRAMRGWKLASKIADVFDQYLIYRPDMILDWENRKLHTQNVDAEKWQMRLWNRLMKFWDLHYQGEHVHRARLLDDLWNALDHGEIESDELPDHISVFGVTFASRAFIKTMAKLSEIIDVRFYQLSVNPEITDSTEFQHPLLQSLAQQGSDFMAMIHDSVDAEMESVVGEEKTEGFLFSSLQYGLKTDKERNQNVTADHSIRVHNCHSPMREVEVLYDELLTLLDENRDLNPEEILIMSPDIEAYAPVIEAVFGTPDKGQPQIPFAIADRGIRGTNPAIETFLDILELCESRFKVTDVLDLLDSKPVRKVFSFTDDDLNRIERWVSDNRVRWGVDGPDKQRMGLPDSNHFTWQSALRRILLGYVMRPSEDKLYDDIYAYNEVESSDDADLAGRLSIFLNRLFEINDAIEGPRKVENWGQLLGTVTDYFLPDSRDYFWELNTIREAITNLDEQSRLAGYGMEVPFTIVRRWISEQLSKQTTGGGRIGRGVTFSSLMPMRGIPFKVIGMIGLNEDAFPRSKIPIEFDLMHLDSRVGDPLLTDEDRFLFLENMLSARTHLYFSYVGQSNRQDADYPPSVVLSELLGYLEEDCEIDTEKLVAKHRLQGFSQNYFDEDTPASYSKERKKISERLANAEATDGSFFSEVLPEPDDEWRKLSIRDLVSFFQHPSKYLLQNRLGIYLRDKEVLTEDREPFTMDKLSEYQVRQELLDRFLKEQSLDEFQKVMKARDMLPEGWSGEQEYHQNAQIVREFGEEIQHRMEHQQAQEIDVDLDIDGFRLLGKLENIYPGAQMNYRLGKARPKDLVGFWIRHLFFQLVKPGGQSGESKYFSWDKKIREKALPAVEGAEYKLSELLRLYQLGLQKPLEFYCKSSYAYAEMIYKKNKEEDKAISKAKATWEGNRYSFGEGTDPYYKVIADGRALFDDTFAETTRTVWGPYFEVLNNGIN
ncbi:MAG: exodeoxyribonuclease V subunit gamma [Bacteroidota bacterium]